jgi:predicted nucleotidyltransferase
MLEKLLRSNAEVKVLGVVLETDGLHLREIARRAGVSSFEAKRELGILTSLGLLRREEKGNLVLFYPEKTCPFLGELRGLYEKTEGVFGRLRRALAGVAGIEYAFVYGSFARGEYGEKSDVDLMVIGKPDMGLLNRKVMEAEVGIGREVNYSVHSEEEFLRKATLGGLIREVISNKKIFLRGSEDGFERFIKAGRSAESGAGQGAGKRMPKGGRKGT